MEHTRPSGARIAGGVTASLVGLVLAYLCLAMAQLMTFGLYSWQEPSVDGHVAIPLIGVAVTLPLGPLVLSVSRNRRRWLLVAAGVSVVGVLLASLFTWVPVVLGWR